jgi:hypothetical protein
MNLHPAFVSQSREVKLRPYRYVCLRHLHDGRRSDHPESGSIGSDVMAHCPNDVVLIAIDSLMAPDGLVVVQCPP